MKKLLLSIPAILSGAVIFVSCNKEAGTTQRSRSTARTGEVYSFNSHGECINDGANCYAYNGPIIITPKVLEAISGAERGGKVIVGEVFRSEELNMLCAEMGGDLGTLLQSGDYYITKNYESAHVINYMVGRFYPVTPNTMVTAFQLPK